ncbi:MAG TPA: type 4a pilus biogenesis protein PilO [Verrucomicrobiae bacterium]|nr:type 4a pilus biogenesis protein PilO [Verrucomicrobiae bacterium]
MNPTIEKALKIPNKQKVLLLVVSVAAVVAVMYFLLYQPKQKEYAELRAKLETLNTQVAENRKVANNLPKYKAEFEKLSKDLEAALTELPNQKEIPSLLTSITNLGKEAGVDFLLFKPRAEEPKDFYAAVPVDITVSGSFYSISKFFALVARMPRIVNLSNLAFTDIKEAGNKTSMKVTCLATTFRFLTPQEKPQEKKK